MDGLKQILERVRKPGRYIGGEVNSVRKRFSKGRVSIALAYPDLYEVGMSYLGLKILYHLLNERDDVVCERVFAPWIDMERELIASGRSLFSLESKTQVNQFDIVGFSLCYELTYTNVLNMLHLSGITVRSRERGEDEPIVIAGGSCCFNPEPMSEFIDIFFIGDAEETLPMFIDAYQNCKRSSLTRKQLLKRLSRLPGIYVPSLYSDEYRNEDFAALIPKDSDTPTAIEKSTIPDLEKAYYPVKQIVPLIETVHDRIAVEIMRGCPHRCRFCQASTINSPVRLRKPDTIKTICRETYKHTGCERIALLSLSSVDYPYLPELVRHLNMDFREKGIGVSIPSLRIDEAFYELPEMISAIRKAGLTFAPESADGNIRQAIGKNIAMKALHGSAELAYRHGWKRLKLYFMTGFPGQTDTAKEVNGIIHLAQKLSDMRKATAKHPADIKVSVNAFVPKPHTPFQWLGMQEKGLLTETKEYLLSSASRKTKVEFHDINKSLLEGCLSRGNRRTARVIYAAWRKGAKMDSWTDLFDISIWEQAFEKNKLHLQGQATRTYGLDDTLPWSHIRTGVNSEHLKEGLLDSSFFDFHKSVV